MAGRPDLSHRGHGFLEIVEAQAAGVFVPAHQLLAVGGEFGIAARQPGFQPSRRVPDIVGACENGGMHQHVGLVARLRVVDLRPDMETRRAPGQPVFPRQRTHQIHHLRRFRRAAHRSAGLHVHRNHELPVDLRRSRTQKLREGHAGQRFGVHLRHRADRGCRRRSAAQGEGRQDQGLVVTRIDLHRVQHGGVPDERRVAVGDRRQHGIVADIVLAEHDAGHRHRVFGTVLRRDDAHEGLVGMLQCGLDDVKVPLGHRDIHRLADDRAR